MSDDPPQIDPTYLPDEPDVWSRDIDGYIQMWRPGAFGNRKTIEGVFRFRVIDDEWTTGDDGIRRRVITKAEAIRQ